jgi:hypothetical protein
LIHRTGHQGYAQSQNEFPERSGEASHSNLCGRDSD